MAELSINKETSKGSGRKISLLEDTNSDIVRELVNQLNVAEIPVSQSISAADGVTERVVLGSWRNEAWIREIRLINAQDNALTNAATDIIVRYCDADDVDMAAGPTSPTDILVVEGFNGANFPAETALWGDEFVAGTNCVAVTGDGVGFYVPAGKVVYAEFINNEGATREIAFQLQVTMTDYLDLKPGPIPRRPTRDFHVFLRGDE